MNMITTNLFSRDNMEILSLLKKSFSNDFELGREVRNHFNTDSFVISLCNDQDLGKEIRKSINITQNNIK